MSAVEYRMVEGFPGYRVGSDGSVWGRNSTKAQCKDNDGWYRLRAALNEKGYLRVALWRPGARKVFRVNILVLKTFAGNPPDGMKNPTAAHLNGIRTDNRIENLEWKTQKDNIGDKVKHGTAQIGEKHPRSILTDEKVLKIRELRRTGMKWREIAEIYGVSMEATRLAGKGYRWKHLKPAVA